MPNAKKDQTASLALSAELTPELADVMRCREAVFRQDGKPHSNITRHDIDGILRDVDLSLPSGTTEGYDTYRPEDIASFRVEVDGMLVRLNMLCRIKGHYSELTDMLARLNADDFEFAIRSLKREFDWNGGIGGTRAEVGTAAGTAEQNGELFKTAAVGECLFCDRGVPKNEDGRHIADGELAVCGGSRSPAIPDVREMGQKRERRQRTRAEMAQPSDEELQAGVEVVQ